MLLLEALKEILIQITTSDFVLVDLHSHAQESDASAQSTSSPESGEASQQQGDATNLNNIQENSWTQETFHSNLKYLTISFLNYYVVKCSIFILCIVLIQFKVLMNGNQFIVVNHVKDLFYLM